MSVLSVRRALAALAVLGGALASLAGSPYRAQHAFLDVEDLAAAIRREEDHVTAVELAEWIRDGKPGLRVIDVGRAPDNDGYPFPTSDHVPLESLATTPFLTTDTIVLVSEGGAHAAQAWVFLRALGYRQVYFLRGGADEWREEVMSPMVGRGAGASSAEATESARRAALSRYFGGRPRLVEGRDRLPVRQRRRGC